MRGWLPWELARRRVLANLGHLICRPRNDHLDEGGHLTADALPAGQAEERAALEKSNALEFGQKLGIVARKAGQDSVSGSVAEASPVRPN